MLGIALAWVVFAFAGVYGWTIPPLCLLVGLTVWQHWPLPALRNRWVAIGMLGCLIIPVLQQWLGTTKNPEQTYVAFLILASAAVTCLVARTVAPAVVYRIVVGLTWAVLLIVLVLPWRSELVYGFWAPIDGVHPVIMWPDPQGYVLWPFGPFVNRNDASCWLLLALGLSFGGRSLWVITTLVIGVAMAGSRSGMIAAGIMLLAWSVPQWTRLTMATVSVAITGLAYLLLTNGEGFQIEDHWRNWNQVVALVDRPWLGVGVGAWPLFPGIPHAENQLLQVLGEGGIVLLVCVGLLVVGLGRTTSQRWTDPWTRGAALGLCGAGVQTLTESSLSRPANLMLAAVLAGVILRNTR